MELKFFINLLLSYAGVAIYLGGAILIYSQSLRGGEFSRARKALAVQLLMWAIFALLPCFDNPVTGPVIDIRLMSVVTLAIGGFSTIVSLPYPFELAQPGWITTRNMIDLILPFTLVMAVYFLVLAIQGQPVIDLQNYEEMMEQIGTFNIWFRFVIYLAVCMYLAKLFLSTSIATLRHNKLSVGDTTPVNRHQVIWLRLYGIGQACIAMVYFVLLIDGTLTVQIIHRSVALIFFSIVIYMVGFRSRFNCIDKNCYPPFFR